MDQFAPVGKKVLRTKIARIKVQACQDPKYRPLPSTMFLSFCFADGHHRTLRVAQLPVSCRRMTPTTAMMAMVAHRFPASSALHAVPVLLNPRAVHLVANIAEGAHRWDTWRTPVRVDQGGRTRVSIVTKSVVCERRGIACELSRGWLDCVLRNRSRTYSSRTDQGADFVVSFTGHHSRTHAISWFRRSQ